MNATPQDSILNASNQVDVVLSQEELLLILNLLQRNMIFGLDPEPLGELSPEQQSYGLVCAERALRARDLARLDEDGSLLIQGNVLNAVGACALAQQVFAVHLTSKDGRGDRLVAYRMNEQAVAQTTPGPMLHRFVTLPSVPVMLQVLANALLPDATTMLPAGEFTIQVSAEHLNAARTFAEANDAAGAATALQNGSSATPAAESFAKLLSSPHNIAVLHVITLLGGDQVASQEVTVISDAHSAWLMFEQANGSVGSGQYQLSTLSQERLADILASLVSQPA